MSDRHNPLVICVTAGGEMQIRIGIDTLAWAFEQRERKAIRILVWSGLIDTWF